MYWLNASRMRLLTLLLKGGTVAEVGVAWGGFAKHILHNAQPETLHLIDFWENIPNAKDAALTAKRLNGGQNDLKGLQVKLPLDRDLSTLGSGDMISAHHARAWGGGVSL